MIPPGRAERSRRLVPYFEAQLRLAARMGELLGRPLGQMAFEYTNLHRRFGLGYSGIVPPGEVWLAFAERLDAAPDLSAQVEMARAMFEASPEEQLPLPGQLGFGCFAYEPIVSDGEVHVHFHNLDTDDEGGPLASVKIARRKGELAAMVASIRATLPDARAIRGGSWLYHLEAYRRLFPADYTASRRLRPGPLHLTGTSSWGQLIDSRENIRPQVRDALMANLPELDPQTPWAIFPYRVLAVSAPLESFERFYGL